MEYTDNKCMYIKEASNYEKLYSLNVLGVENRGDDRLDVLSSFKASIKREQMAGISGLDYRYFLVKYKQTAEQETPNQG